MDILKTLSAVTVGLLIGYAFGLGKGFALARKLYRGF